ncbi:low-specificity L-threonine aldolase [bacterium]|nr:low-specificity L-threonine aldolase [bacterium]
MRIVDLRSDTVTKPTPSMMEAIMNAELGDDVLGDDPTAQRLEEISAKRVGKEASMFVPSGTMANLVCALTHCARGEEVILGDVSHIFLNEAGSMSAVGGIHPHLVPNQPDGTIKLEDIEAAVRGDNVHWPRTRLICLENTHNRCYGGVLTPGYIESVCQFAKERGISVHLDGARVFNAAVALGVDVTTFTRSVDSVMFCLSKGLSAPIGSMVCGTDEFIAEARRNRKVLGGGMRQVGIIAAAGIKAVEEMPQRLHEDHFNARKLAEGIAGIPGLATELDRIKTNIIYFDITTDKLTPDELVNRLGDRGVKLLSTGPKRFRAVTHYGITEEDIDIALVALREVMGETN